MKPHLRIAEDRDGGPGLARKAVSQEMIDGPADFFIIGGLGDAGHASMSEEAKSCIIFESSRPHLPSSALVLPFAGPAVQKTDKIRL